MIAIVTVLALRFEFGHSWNLYAAGGQVAKAGEDYPLLLQAVGSAYQETGGELVHFCRRINHSRTDRRRLRCYRKN